MNTRLVLLLAALPVYVGCSRVAERETPAIDRKTAEHPTLTPESERGRAASEHPSRRPDQSAVNASPPEDKGIFPDLDQKVALRCPPWLAPGPYLAVRPPGASSTWLSVDGVIVCEAPADSVEKASALVLENVSQDRDNDGIPDAVDILRGAKKAVINGAKYKNSYRPLAFPGGDVPRDEGVCTDVVIRALRNTGLDLQELLSRDIAARPKAYPMVKKPDPHIDHRRVRTLLPYFESAFENLPTDPKDSAFPYLPGDIVFMNTMGDTAPEHMGIVSDELGSSGLPLIVNNWTEGTVTREMDLLRTVPVTHRFRAVGSLLLGKDQHGLQGVLSRQKITLPKQANQILLVTTPLFRSSGGTLRRFERRADGFVPVGAPLAVRIGSQGLASGRGILSNKLAAPAAKKEGDKKSPAGVFRLGTAFGVAKNAPSGGKGWPYRSTTARDFWVDDPMSEKYNKWISLGEGETLTVSAERLQMYSLGLVVEHNTSDTVGGAGSAIFLHPWRDAATSTVGCTALKSEDLVEVLGWLDEGSEPLLVQVAEHVFEPREDP